MRTLSATLEAAQKSLSYSPLWKIVLSRSGQTTRTYSTERVLRISHSEEADSQQAEVLLLNNDNALTSLDFEAYQGVLSYGAKTSSGDEYSATAPMKVVSQQLISEQGILYCLLNLIGTPDLMAKEEAESRKQLNPGDTQTSKTIISAIAGATYAPYTSYTAITVTYDSEDTLLDTYKPADSFNVYVGNSRLKSIKELFALTGSYFRMEADGAIHVKDPVISGATYDYEYVFNSSGDHTFYLKNVRNRVVSPNKVIVQSKEGDAPSYTGNATSATSFALLPIVDVRELRLYSNAQAASIAAAIIEKAELDAEKASAVVPMNFGQEVLDYIKITDSRQGDSVTGNVQYLKRIVDITKGKPDFKMEIRFGKLNESPPMPVPMLQSYKPLEVTTPSGVSREELVYAFNQLATQVYDDFYSLFEGVWNLQQSVMRLAMQQAARCNEMDKKIERLEMVINFALVMVGLSLWAHVPYLDTPTKAWGQPSATHSPALTAPSKAWGQPSATHSPGLNSPTREWVIT